MCGITGAFAIRPEGRLQFEYLNAALRQLHKRGPDAQGTFFSDHAVLGHARLSIIDVSAAAAQPFYDPSGRYVIVFNGEIFNFKILRNGLLNKGVSFTSSSDTEVLLHLYIHYGKECLPMLNGFFAFAIYDRNEHELFIARDRYGIKPLLYFNDGNALVFASEMKALLEYAFDKTLDKSAIHTYFHLNYLPPGLSVFKHVFKLPPGTCLFINNKSEQLHTYYQIPVPDETVKNPVLNYDAACRQLRTLLEDAVNLRLVSDVPLGTFLSGGIDSSIITALAAKNVQHLSTFSIGFKDETHFDETDYALQVAKKWQTEHTVFKVGNDDLFHELFSVLDYIDEPFADSSALNVYLLSKLTRKKVTVALSGDGADEMFAGYNKHRAEYLLRNQKAVRMILPVLKSFSGFVPQSRNSRLSNISRQVEKLGRGNNLGAKDRYWEWAGFSVNSYHTRLFKPLYESELNIMSAPIIQKYTAAIKGGPGVFNDVLLADMGLVLPGDMLTKVDLMSMANSLEVRVPFLDYRVVDFAFSLPSSYKIDNKNRKKILKDTFRKELPQEIFRRNKQGFEVPLLKWLRNDLNSLVQELLMDVNFLEKQNLFNPDVIREQVNTLHSANPGDAASRVWALIVFQYWWKKI